jgi:hypothetical protein
MVIEQLLDKKMGKIGEDILILMCCGALGDREQGRVVRWG